MLLSKSELLDFDDADLENTTVNINEISCIKIKTAFEYNENNQIVKIILPTNEYLMIDYDDDGNINCNATNIFINNQSISKSNENIFELLETVKTNETSVNIFDKHGRIVKKNYSDSTFEIFEYDYANNISLFINRNKEKIKFEYNSINKLKTTIDSNGKKTIFLYGMDGEIKCIKHE